MNEWKHNAAAYFERYEKPKSAHTLGVEVEHFILDAQGKSVDYAGECGVRTVLEKLMHLYPQAEVLADDAFFGFKVPDFNITLEPAAQLEISIAPRESVAEICTIYEDFLLHLHRVLEPLGYRVCYAGYRPQDKAESLALIPKRRYALMDAYFKDCGSGGVQMMRGTASVQVSVDYTSREDFRRKIQAAYYYAPLLKLLCDNVPHFEGAPCHTHLKRTDIWRRVDSARCGILPGIFSPNYDYENYIDFLAAMPPIFLKTGEQIEPTGKQTVETLFANRQMSEAALEHILSMAFPDVRLKQFLEIRVADAVPMPFIVAYTALIKGLLYTQDSLDFVQTRLREQVLCESDIIRAEDDIMQNGWGAQIYGMPVAEFSETVLTMAQCALPESEQPLVNVWRAVAACGGIANLSPAHLSALRKTTFQKEIKLK